MCTTGNALRRTRRKKVLSDTFSILQTCGGVRTSSSSLRLAGSENAAALYRFT